MSALRRSVLTCASGILLVVSGCASESHTASSAAATPSSTSTSSRTATPSNRASATPSSSTEAAGASSSPVGPDPGNPSPLPKVTPAGARMTLGQKIIARVPADVDGEKNGWAYLEVGVTDVVRGDQKVYDSLSNKADFPGGTVWYVKGTVKVLALSGIARGGMVDAPIAGLQGDGKPASTIFGTATVKDCDGNFLLDGAKIGQEASTCAVAIAAAGQKVVGALYYHDDAITDGATPADPYVKNPVSWMR